MDIQKMTNQKVAIITGGSSGIGISIIAPGAIGTEMWEQGGE